MAQLKKAKPYKVKNGTGGRFAPAGEEPIDSPTIGLRLTMSLYKELERVAGKQKTAFVREAIAEKLNRVASGKE